jgi:hypothetical protein
MTASSIKQHIMSLEQLAISPQCGFGGIDSKMMSQMKYGGN